MIFDQIVQFLNVYKLNTNLLTHFWVKKNSMSFHDDSLSQQFHCKKSQIKHCWFSSLFWGSKLFKMKGLKWKNPKFKVEGTFKIRGEFSRHNPRGKKWIRNKALFLPNKNRINFRRGNRWLIYQRKSSEDSHLLKVWKNGVIQYPLKWEIN